MSPSVPIRVNVMHSQTVQYIRSDCFKFPSMAFWYMLAVQQFLIVQAIISFWILSWGPVVSSTQSYQFDCFRFGKNHGPTFSKLFCKNTVDSFAPVLGKKLQHLSIKYQNKYSLRITPTIKLNSQRNFNFVNLAYWCLLADEGGAISRIAGNLRALTLNLKNVSCNIVSRSDGGGGPSKY